jgi:hypothetical protein
VLIKALEPVLSESVSHGRCVDYQARREFVLQIVCNAICAGKREHQTPSQSLRFKINRSLRNGSDYTQQDGGCCGQLTVIDNLQPVCREGYNNSTEALLVV